LRTQLDLRVAVEQLQREVAERKRAEEALRKSEELSRLGMQVGRTCTFEWNAETDEVRRSYNCSGILGIPGDASNDTQTAFLQRIHPEDREGFLQKLRGPAPPTIPANPSIA
jgi:PAS domain-containing protein